MEQQGHHPALPFCVQLHLSEKHLDSYSQHTISETTPSYILHHHLPSIYISISIFLTRVEMRNTKNQAIESAQKRTQTEFRRMGFLFVSGTFFSITLTVGLFSGFDLIFALAGIVSDSLHFLSFFLPLHTPTGHF